MLENIILYIVNSGGTVTSKEIASRFRINDCEGNFTTRMKIKEAMRLVAVKMGIPIGADNRGYYFIETKEELDKYVSNLEQRIQGIQERIDIVKEAWRNQ